MTQPNNGRINKKGTSSTSWEIGKDGPIIEQVAGDPDRALLPQKMRWPPSGAAQSVLGTTATGDIQQLSDSDIGKKTGMQAIFMGTAAYAQTANTTIFQNLGYFIFDGTTVHTPTLAEMILSSSNNSNTLEVRIFDETNGLLIALFSYAGNTTPQIFAQAPSNLPVNQAIFSVAGRRSSGLNTRARVHSLSFR